MRVSVVICAYTLDRWDGLKAAVQSCIEQTLEPIEVIVVIDYNDELFGRASLEFLNARVVANRMTKGLSGARNTGVLISSGETIAFLDDDAFAEHDWLQELVAPMNDQTVAGSGGWIVPHWESKNPSWFPETFYWILGCSYSGLPPSNSSIRNPIGANMAIRREVFAQVGGFTSGIGRIGVIPLGCEETELCIRYTANNPGERFLLTREAVVHHRVPASRLTWHYFWTRCWAEGLSKAAVSSLAGSDSGLSAERQHVMRSLPRELGQNVQMLRRHPRTALARTALVVAGTFLAGAGLIRGRISLYRNPLKTASDEQVEFLQVLEGGVVPGPFPVQEPALSKNKFGSRQVKDEVSHEVHVSSEGWQPVAIAQVDLDVVKDVDKLDVVPGQRIWVEALREGQVVGVLEARAEKNGTLSDEFLSKLRSTFSDSTPSFDGFVSYDLLPKATVVIPTICRDPARLVRTVDAVLACDYPEFDIIVVDNRTDSKRDPLPAFSGDGKVRVVVEPRRGVSAARNRGIANATGDFVAFTDDDVMVEPNWLRALGTRFVLSPEVEAIGGLVLPRELRTQAQLWFEEFFGGFNQSFHLDIMSEELLDGIDGMFPYSPGRFGAACNMAVRRSVLEQKGGFDVLLGTGTPSRGGEDLKFFMNIVFTGGTCAFEPGALARHTHRETEEDFMTQVFGYGAGLTAMFTDLVVRDPRHLVEVIRRIPRGLGLITRRRENRSPSSAPGYPMRTYLLQLLGMVYGPLAYLRSVAKTKWFARY